MSDEPIPGRGRKKERPSVGQLEGCAEPIKTDDDAPVDNRYAPASGIFTPIRAPVAG